MPALAVLDLPTERISTDSGSFASFIVTFF